MTVETRERIIKYWGSLLNPLLEPIIPNEEFVILMGQHFQKHISFPDVCFNEEQIELFKKFKNELLKNPNCDQVLLFYYVYDLPRFRKIKLDKIKNRINDTNR